MRSALVVAALAFLLTGCGSTDPAPVTTVADGRYRVEGLGPDTASASEPAEAMLFEVDARFGGLEIDTSCGTLFGSYTLADDGTAGVTVAGGSSRDCSEQAAIDRAALMTILAGVDQWTGR